MSVEFVRPTSWMEALAAKAADPELVPIAGGTDLMVGLNLGHHRYRAMMDLGSLDALAEFESTDRGARVGAAVPFSDIICELGDAAPGLAIAARTIGSPQIRNRGTIGGNLATASPAGDAAVALLAIGAEVEVASSARGARVIPIDEFFVGTKRSALARDELIAAVRLPARPGVQQFAKIGTRNAMVIAVCSLAVAIDTIRRTVRIAIGSAGPTPLRAPAAETFLHGVLEERDIWEAPGELTDVALARAGELVAASARPIDDIRGTAAYRRRALAVLTRRLLTWSAKGHGHSGP